MAPSSTRMRSAATRRSVCSGTDMFLEIATDIAAVSGVLPLPGGERGGVRGFGCLSIERAQDVFKHTIGILQDIVVPITQDEISHRFKNRGPVLILFDAGCMLA